MPDRSSDASLRGGFELFGAQACARLGRAFGTLLRRMTSGGRHRIVVARTNDRRLLSVRDGFVAGLILAGHDVVDAGTNTRHVEGAPAAVVARADEGGVALTFFVAGRALAHETVQELHALAEGEDFSAGEGSLEIV